MKPTALEYSTWQPISEATSIAGTQRRTGGKPYLTGRVATVAEFVL